MLWRPSLQTTPAITDTIVTTPKNVEPSKLIFRTHLRCSSLSKKLRSVQSPAERDKLAADFQSAIEELAATLERTAPNMKVGHDAHQLSSVRKASMLPARPVRRRLHGTKRSPGGGRKHRAPAIPTAACSVAD